MKFIQLAIITSIFLFLSSCSKSDDESNMTVATSADNPPYEFIKEGKIVGLDIDVLNAVAEKLNKKVVLKNLDFHGIIASLNTNNVDLAVAGLSVTPERSEVIDFSEVYVKTNIVLMYRKADPFAKTDELHDKKIGAQLGSIWQGVAEDIKAKHGSTTHLLASNLMLVQELKSKTIDAMLLEEAQAKQFVIQHPELSFFVLDEYKTEFAIALPKNSPLKNDVNKALGSLKAEGVLDKIKEKWLGAPKAE
jgi:polar amino acid transport system substrate-binding protein